MRVVFLQYGDYREAYERFASGGAETYYAQRYTVDFVGKLADELDYVAVVCVASDQPAVPLQNGVETVGVRVDAKGSRHQLWKWLEAARPTHLIVRTPLAFVLRRATQHGWSVLPQLADSFEENGLRPWWRYRRLRKTLDHPQIAWIGNHGLNACRSLRRIGVAPQKIIPYDVPPPTTPADRPAKDAPARDQRWRLIYAGSLLASKGVGDLIEAVAVLRRQGHDATLTVVGQDVDGQFPREASRQGISPFVDFRGRLPHAEVLELMRQHELVVIPSRHTYPEGIPYVTYDAFTARTPLIVSDHPMFADNVVDGKNGLVFQAANVQALTHVCRRLMSDAGLYRRLSENSLDAWQHLQMKAEWGDMIRRFLEGPEKHEAWQQTHCLVAVERMRRADT